MDLKKLFQIVCGLLITAGAVLFFIKTVDLKQVGPALGRIDALTVLLAAFFCIFSLYLRGVRWRLLLPSDPSANPRGLFALCSISFMVNNLLPARVGEAARVVLAYKRNGYSLHVSIGSVLAERVADMFCYSLFILIPYFTYRELLAGRSILSGFPLHRLIELTLLLAVAVLLILVLCFALLKKFDRIEAALVRRLRIFEGGVRHVMRLVRESTAFLADARKCVAVFLLSPVVIGCYTLIFLLIARSVGLEVTWLQALFTAGFMALGAAIPSSPGYVGTLHALVLQGLLLIGLTSAKAGAVAIIFHAAGYISTTALGLWFFFRADLRLRDLPARPPVKDE